MNWTVWIPLQYLVRENFRTFILITRASSQLIDWLGYTSNVTRLISRLIAWLVLPIKIKSQLWIDWLIDWMTWSFLFDWLIDWLMYSTRARTLVHKNENGTKVILKWTWGVFGFGFLRRKIPLTSDFLRLNRHSLALSCQFSSLLLYWSNSATELIFLPVEKGIHIEDQSWD